MRALLLILFCLSSYSSQTILEQKIAELKRTIKTYEKRIKNDKEGKSFFLREIDNCELLLEYLEGKRK